MLVADALAGGLLAVATVDVGDVGLCGRTSPTAAPTSGSAWTFVSSDAGIVTPLPLVEFLTTSLPRMTASVLDVDSANRPLNDFCSVSVSMNVPGDHRDADHDGEGGQERRGACGPRGP